MSLCLPPARHATGGVIRILKPTRGVPSRDSDLAVTQQLCRLVALHSGFTVGGWEGEVVPVEPSGSFAFRVSGYVPARPQKRTTL